MGYYCGGGTAAGVVLYLNHFKRDFPAPLQKKRINDRKLGKKRNA